MDDCLYGGPFMKWMHPTVCPHVSCLCASSDHEYADGYRVQIVSAPPRHTCQTTSCKNCRARLGNVFTILHDVAFDNKVSCLTALLKKVAVVDTACIVHACTVVLFFISAGQPYIGSSWNRSSWEVLSIFWAELQLFDWCKCSLLYITLCAAFLLSCVPVHYSCEWLISSVGPTQVYALPQRNVSATGRALFAVANWKSVFVACEYMLSL